MKILLLSLFALLSIEASAQEINHLKVGDTLPNTNIHLDTGEAVSALDQLGGKPAVLVFYRGGWCPFCVKQLAGLNDITDELKAEGIQLVAVSPDKVEKLKAKETLADLDYTFASDSKMEFSQALGIAFKVDDETVEKYKGWGIDLEGDSGETHHMLPHPSVFVVDGKGKILYAHVDANYRERLSTKELLEAVKASTGN